MAAGYVYFFSNEAMPGIVKIGFSQTTLRERSKGLVTTGVPKKFELEFAISTLEPQKLEKVLHRHFRKYHYDKEFFKCDLVILIKETKLLLETEKILFIDYEGRASQLFLTENDHYKLKKNKDELEELKKNKELQELVRSKKKIEDINLEKDRQKLINDIAKIYAKDFERYQLLMAHDYSKSKKKYESTISGKFKNRSRLWDLGVGLSTFFVGTYLMSKVDDALNKEADEIAKLYAPDQIDLIKKFVELEREVLLKTSEYQILNEYEVLEYLNREFGISNIYHTGPKTRRMPPDYKVSITEHFAIFSFEFSGVVSALNISRVPPMLDKADNKKFEWELTEWGVRRNDQNYTIPISFIKILESGVLVDYQGEKLFVESKKIKNFKS
jgi:hypothetical protein